MNANGAAASGARPSPVFIPQKSSDAEIPDVYKIIDHAHGVFRAVSFVEMFQHVTGKILALETILLPASLQGFAGLDLAPDTRDGFPGVGSQATDTLVLFSQICHADAAVHPARSYERSR